MMDPVDNCFIHCLALPFKVKGKAISITWSLDTPGEWKRLMIIRDVFVGIFVLTSKEHESTVTLVSTSLELISNTVPTSSFAALGSNEEWVNAMVDGPGNEMVDGAANAKPENVFVQGASHVVDDATELTVTGSECVSFGPGNVVVALSAGEKGDGYAPSSTVEEGRGAFLGKGIMTDVVAASSVGASRLQVSSGLAPSFREFSGDAIHRDFFPFSSGPYYPTYPEGGIAGNCEFTRKEWDAPYQPTLTVLTKEMSVLHCLMMSHGGELLARSMRQVTRLNDKLSAFDASFSKSKAKGKGRKKKIKSHTKSLDNLHAEVVRLSADLNRATVLEAEKDKEILRLKATPPEFSSFFRGQFQALV
nr:hypothetical protein [Tanacetum cinerariifolium]